MPRRRRKKVLVLLGLVLAVFAGHLALKEFFRRSVLQDGDDAQDVFDIQRVRYYYLVSRALPHGEHYGALFFILPLGICGWWM